MTLIGPLTADEWVSLRLGSDEDPLQCCADTSDLRDAIFDTLRMGAEPDQDVLLRAAWEYVAEDHPGLTDHPVLAKLHAYYVAGREPVTPWHALAHLMAVPRSEITMWVQAARGAFDLDSPTGRTMAVSRLAPKAAKVVDPAERADAAAEIAQALGLPRGHVTRLVEAWRHAEGLEPVTTRLTPHTLDVAAGKDTDG